MKAVSYDLFRGLDFSSIARRCDDMPWPTVGIHEWIGRERSASDHGDPIENFAVLLIKLA